MVLRVRDPTGRGARVVRASLVIDGRRHDRERRRHRSPRGDVRGAGGGGRGGAPRRARDALLRAGGLGTGRLTRAPAPAPVTAAPRAATPAFSPPIPQKVAIRFRNETDRYLWRTGGHCSALR